MDSIFHLFEQKQFLQGPRGEGVVSSQVILDHYKSLKEQRTAKKSQDVKYWLQIVIPSIIAIIVALITTIYSSQGHSDRIAELEKQVTAIKGYIAQPGTMPTDRK